jgi:hypothetical protein
MQGLGPFRGSKFVEIAEIRRGRAPGRGLDHGLMEQRGAAAADLAKHEQVVIGLVHVEAEVGRAFRPLLADPGQGLVEQFGGVGKPQGFRGMVRRRVLR